MTTTDRPSAGELKLLSCPFCNSRNVGLRNGAAGNWVACISCGLEAPSETGVTADQAIKYWNTRPPVAGAEAGVRERLQQLCEQWPHSIYSEFHLENWTAADFAKHTEATAKTIRWLVYLQKEIHRMRSLSPPVAERTRIAELEKELAAVNQHLDACYDAAKVPQSASQPLSHFIFHMKRQLEELTSPSTPVAERGGGGAGALDRVMAAKIIKAAMTGAHTGRIWKPEEVGFAEIYDRNFLVAADAILAALPSPTPETGDGSETMTERCPYCSDGARTGLPGNACENCMNTGLKYPERGEDQ